MSIRPFEREFFLHKIAFATQFRQKLLYLAKPLSGDDILNEIKRHYMHSGCQNGISSIFQEYLGKVIKLKRSENFEGDV